MPTCRPFKRLYAAALIVLCIMLLPIWPVYGLNADPSPSASPPPPVIPESSSARKLLEQSLSSAEIEQEIERISAEQLVLEKKVPILEAQAEAKEAAIADKKTHAAAILRAYYMGEREGLLASLLNAGSFSQMLALLDYYDIVMGADRDILGQYEKEYKSLREATDAAKRSAEELASIRTALEEQKQRVAALNEEIENGIKSSSDPAGMSALLEEFSQYWENIGIYEVRKYFKALSSAMNRLPNYVQKEKGVLSRKGMTYTIALKDEQLNAFLASQNELLKNFSFRFYPDKVTASGTSGNLSLTVTGHYSIQEEPENALMFHIDQVVFNGLQLPEATCKKLEQEFDLGFYPQEVVSFLRASDVSSENGVLYVKLSLSF